MLEPTLPRPQLVNRLPFGKIVHDQDESMVVVAIQDFDVDSSVGHQPGERTELTWDSLLQAQAEHISFLNDANTLRFESAACRRAVLEQKMGDAGDSSHQRGAVFARDMPRTFGSQNSPLYATTRSEMC